MNESDNRSSPGAMRTQASRMKMRCGYAGCSYNGQKRSFLRHNAVKHRGQAIVFQNNAFGHGGRWRDWVVLPNVEVDGNTDEPGVTNNETRPASSEGEI